MTISKTRIINIKKNNSLYEEKNSLFEGDYRFFDNKAEKHEINENNFSDFEFHIFKQGRTLRSQINKKAVPSDYALFYIRIVENEYYNCTDEETIENHYLCDLMINSKYKLEWYDRDEPCDAENIYFLTLEDAVAEAMTQSV